VPKSSIASVTPIALSSLNVRRCSALAMTGLGQFEFGARAEVVRVEVWRRRTVARRAALLSARHLAAKP
jgi:hypothetical protein